MARPRASDEQRMQAYDLHRAGFGPSVIRKRLSDDFGASVVSLRTITTWVGGFKHLSPEVQELDAPFEFNKMEEYGLPWSACAYLLQILAFWADGKLLWQPTVREMLWFWRIHLAVPEFGVIDAWGESQRFVMRERVVDLTGNSDSFADLYARLALKPWMGKERLETYDRAIEKERIAPIVEKHPPGGRYIHNLLTHDGVTPTTSAADYVGNLLHRRPDTRPSDWTEVVREAYARSVRGISESIIISPDGKYRWLDPIGDISQNDSPEKESDQ